MSVKSSVAWAEAVHAAVSQVPTDLRWRVQVGIVQALKPTLCRRCGQTEFRIASATTVTCIACGTVSGADVEGCPHPGYVDLGYERHRVRVVVRPLNGNQQRSVMATRWRSELSAGLWGDPRAIRESVNRILPRLLEFESTLPPDDFDKRFRALTAMTKVGHGRPIVHVTSGRWSRATWTWELEDKVKEALLRALGCRQGDRWIWYGPTGDVVFERDRAHAEWLAQRDAWERHVATVNRGILPVWLTPARPERQVQSLVHALTVGTAIFPELVDALRSAFPERAIGEVRAVAAATLRHPTGAAAVHQLGDLPNDVQASVKMALRARRRLRAFRRALSGRGTWDMAYATYTLPFADRVAKLRKLKAYLESDGYKVERMYDYLLDPATEPQR